jgi:hypothetical protein
MAQILLSTAKHREKSPLFYDLFLFKMNFFLTMLSTTPMLLWFPPATSFVRNF